MALLTVASDKVKVIWHWQFPLSLTRFYLFFFLNVNSTMVTPGWGGQQQQHKINP